MREDDLAEQKTPDLSSLSAEALIERAIAARGDVFPEWRLIAEASPETMGIVTHTGGYLHKYEGIGGEEQQLSVQMRELIAVPAICGKGDLRHSPNHVRRMYRLGMTNRLIIEGALALAISAGWATMLNVAYAIMLANSTDYPFGKLPEGGEPKELKPFPELTMGRKRISGGDEPIIEKPSWQFAATVDPELVKRISAWTEWCQGSDDRDDLLLGPGPRALISAAGLCTRGDVERAARSIRRAYDYGMTKRQVLEAISSVVPMTGMVSLEVGTEAMLKAEGGAG